jgi:hypothetical protein
MNTAGVWAGCFASRVNSLVLKRAVADLIGERVTFAARSSRTRRSTPSGRGPCPIIDERIHHRHAHRYTVADLLQYD